MKVKVRWASDVDREFGVFEGNVYEVVGYTLIGDYEIKLENGDIWILFVAQCEIVNNGYNILEGCIRQSNDIPIEK